MLLVLTGLLAAIVIGLLIVSRVRHLPRVALVVGALASVALLAILNISDWPLSFLAAFWRDHPIVGATAGALIIAAIVYFLFEAHDRQVQERLDHKTAAVARSGLVDHLVDLDLGLSLIFRPESEVRRRWACLLTPDRPFRWRSTKSSHDLDRRGDVPNPRDPRTGPRLDVLVAEPWHRLLISQAIRRLMTGIKE